MTTARTANPLRHGLIGALVALDRNLHIVRLGGIAAIAGLLHGYQNGTTMAQAGLGASELLGIVSALLIVLTLASALVIENRTGWPRGIARLSGVLIAGGGVLVFMTAARTASV
jgi:hydrogenase/urease accessory protein HupE